ncbi:unnamed protein product, partial [marine sediment metagenome]
YSDDFDGVDCGTVACDGSVSWIYDSVCTWRPTGSAGPCDVSSLYCSGGVWKFTMTHAVDGKTCVYEKPATAASCPAGTYSKVGGTCSDCPSEVTVVAT